MFDDDLGQDSHSLTSPTNALNLFQHTAEDDSSKGYIAWRRRRVNFDPKISATMPRPTPAMQTPSSRFASDSTQMTAERDFYRLKATAGSGSNKNSTNYSSSSFNFANNTMNKEILDDSHWIPQWLREDANNNNNNTYRSSGSSVTSALTNRTTKTSATGAASSALPGEARFYGSHLAGGGENDEDDEDTEDDDEDDSQIAAGAAARRRRRRIAKAGGNISDLVLPLEELINSPMAFTQRLLDLHDELRDVEAACKILVQKALRLDPKTSVTEILEGSSELSYHSIKVDAVDGEIRRIQREITGTFTVVDGAIIAGSENMPAEKCTSLLDALRACIPEVRSTIRLADTRLTSLLM